MREDDWSARSKQYDYTFDRENEIDIGKPAEKHTLSSTWIASEKRSEDLISVIIPSYNHSRFIRQAILSVAHQTYDNIQLIIIDDGSDDDSIRVIGDTLKQVNLPNVIFDVQENQGAHNTINNGILRSQGEFICILNSDDSYHPSRLAELQQFSRAGKYDFVFSEVIHIDDEANTLSLHLNPVVYRTWLGELEDFPALGFSLLRYNGTISTSNFFFTARLIERVGLFRAYTLVHDWDFVLRVLLNCEPGFFRVPLLYYRVHETNTLSQPQHAGRGVVEYQGIVQNFFRMVKGQKIENRLAPAPQNWSSYFETFLRHESFITFLCPDFPDLWSLWISCEALSESLSQRLPMEEFIPPHELMRLVGSVSAALYKAVGEEFLQYFLRLGQLKPDAHVLDVGCGSGRMAIPLTQYLTANGSYQGFDIVPAAIDWCTATISARYPHFSFHVADVFNKFYNPQGKYKASEYAFPYENESFNFIFLTSVFTHMLPEDMERYLSEIIRVLKRGGRCLITFFFANEDSLVHIQAKRSTILFDNDKDIYRTVSTQNTEEFAICYDESFIKDLYARSGLTVVEPVHYGSWCGRKNFLSYQDIIVAIKP